MGENVYASLQNQIGKKKYMELREYLLKHMPPQVSKQQLLYAYTVSEEEFQKTLQDLTVMPVVNVIFVIRCIGANGWSIEKLYDTYITMPTRRIESIVCCLANCY